MVKTYNIEFWNDRFGTDLVHMYPRQGTNQVSAQQYPSNQWAAQQYQSNQVTAQQYLSNQMAAQQYPSNQVAAQQYLSNQVAAQQYPSNQLETSMCLFWLCYIDVVPICYNVFPIYKLISC